MLADRCPLGPEVGYGFQYLRLIVEDAEEASAADLPDIIGVLNADIVTSGIGDFEPVGVGAGVGYQGHIDLTARKIQDDSLCIPSISLAGYSTGKGQPTSDAVGQTSTKKAR